MIAKNFFGGKILIPFGDWTPSARWDQLLDGTVTATEINDGCFDTEVFGKFSEEGYQQILKEWQEFKDAYYYDDNLAYHWHDRKDPWAITFFGELINSKQ